MSSPVPGPVTQDRRFFLNHLGKESQEGVSGRCRMFLVVVFFLLTGTAVLASEVNVG